MPASTMVYLASLVLVSAAAHAASTAHQYTVRVDDALTVLSVHACFASPVARLQARDAKAAVYLRQASGHDGRSVSLSAEQMVLGAEDRCVDYSVDLAAAATTTRRYRGLDSRSRVVTIAAWLWQPRGNGDTAIEVVFDLPRDMQVSLPWTALERSADHRPRFRVPDSPRSDDAISAFGAITRCDVALPDTTLRVALLGGRQPADASSLFTWIKRAAVNVALTYGRFPNPSPQVLLVPVAKDPGDDDEPVPFGKVIRDGGEAVVFFINQQRPLAEFLADWTATHEFAHLMIPYVNGDENWISEGLASYYQNVLMARSGAYSAEKAWRKIVQGFRRGEAAVPHLSLENAMPIGGWDGIMKTYWGGAALFLIADVELRRRSGNTRSLDRVLGELQTCCLPSPASWNGRDFFRRLDRLVAQPLFEALYDRYRDARAFPDYHATLAGLGVRLDGRRAVFADDAPLASLREAIMARSGPALASPARCAGAP